jgi:hypothetical protein
MLNDFETIDAQSELASLIQAAPNEADQVMSELVFNALQVANGQQPL